MKVRDVLDKYDEVIQGDKKESFQLGMFASSVAFMAKIGLISFIISMYICSTVPVSIECVEYP